MYRHTLYERLATCHLNLKNYSQAKISVNLSKELMRKHEPSNEKLTKRIEKLSKKIEESEKGSPAVSTTLPNINPQIPVPGIREPSSTFPAFSEKVGVDHSPEQGRFVHAKKDVYSCERILEEKPYASCLLPDRMGSWCLHCFARLKAPIACDICANVGFCSKSCKQSADAYHRYECRILALLIGSGMSIVCHLALRIITQNSAAFFLEVPISNNCNE